MIKLPGRPALAPTTERSTFALEEKKQAKICEACGKSHFQEKRGDSAFSVDGKLVLVEDIPAMVCSHCGEANFDAGVAERIRRLVHEPHTPKRVIETEVLNYNAA